MYGDFVEEKKQIRKSLGMGKVTGRPNKFVEIGVRGRKTGWQPKPNIKVDDDGFDNLDDFFASDNEQESFQEEFEFDNDKTPYAYNDSGIRNVLSSANRRSTGGKSRKSINTTSKKENNLRHSGRQPYIQPEQFTRQTFSPRYRQSSVSSRRPSSRYEEIIHEGDEVDYPPQNSFSRSNSLNRFEYAQEYSSPAVKRRSQSLGRTVSTPTHYEQVYEHIPQQPAYIQERFIRSEPRVRRRSSYYQEDEQDDEEEQEELEREEAERRYSRRRSKSMYSDGRGILFEDADELPVVMSHRRRSKSADMPPLQYIYAESPHRNSSSRRRSNLVVDNYTQPVVYQHSAYAAPRTQSIQLQQFRERRLRLLQQEFVEPSPRRRLSSRRSSTKVVPSLGGPDPSDLDEFTRADKEVFRGADNKSYYFDDPQSDTDTGIRRMSEFIEPRPSSTRKSSSGDFMKPGSGKKKSISGNSSNRKRAVESDKSMEYEEETHHHHESEEENVEVVKKPIKKQSKKTRNSSPIPEISISPPRHRSLSPEHMQIDDFQQDDFQQPDEISDIAVDDDARLTENQMSGEDEQINVKKAKSRTKKPKKQTKLAKTQAKTSKKVTSKKLVIQSSDEEEEEEKNIRVKKVVKSIAERTRVIQLEPPIVTDTDGVRRSRRTRITPLAWWDLETAVYRRADEAGSYIGLPELTSITKIQEPSPPAGRSKKKCKSSTTAASKKKKKEKEFDNNDAIEKSSQAQGQVSISVKNYVTGEFEEQDLIVAQSMVNWMETTPDCEYGKTQDFAGNTQASTGFIMLKSGALKPNKNTKANTLTFVVITGKVEVKINDSSVVVGVGTQFSVPAGNQYQLENTGTTDCRIFWVCLTPSVRE